MESCKKSLEFTIPVEEVQAEINKVALEIQKKARMPGFRPGKVPLSIVRRHYDAEIREKVIEDLGTRHFRRAVERDNLKVVGRPHLHEVHFQEGEPMRLTVHFEVAPEFELKDYRDLEVPYEEPVVTEEDIDRRIESLRETKAEFVNIDPRPVQDGDYAVVSLKSLAGLTGAPIEQDEVTLHIGAEDTLAAFSEHLRGMTPGEEKVITVEYPADYGNERLAGKTVTFQVALKAIRRKELPEVNDEFAQDLGDFKDLAELRQAVRTAIYAERESEAQRKAKEALVDKLVSMHDFPVPEAYLDRQIESQVESYLRVMAAQGVDPKNVRLDWEKIRESQKERAIHDVKAALLLDRIADREAIFATSEEVDREVHRIARQRREPVAAVRMSLEKEGALGRIANNIRTDKTLNFLFENARKVAAR